MRLTSSLSLTLLIALGGCAMDDSATETTLEGDLLAEFADVASDEIGIPSTFQQNRVMDDGFFANAQAIDGDGLQRFLEKSPYDNRSWLASETVSGQRAADAIVAASRSKGINPIVMLARMQVEKSLIAQTSRPDRDSVDFAFGCGCPDNRPCNPVFQGLDKQIECAADTLQRHYQGSIDGTGFRRRGLPFTSLDGRTVVPENHATASLYAYTPWVFNGGNHLVWQITRLFALHFQELGELDGNPGDDLAPIEVYWARNEDGSYKLHALASSDVKRVEYFVDGFRIGSSSRALGDNFPDTYSFNVASNERFFEVLGFASEVATSDDEEPIARGVGLIDVTESTAVFIRQLGAGYYDFGLERAPEGVAAIEVTIDELPIKDEISDSIRSERLVVRYQLSQLGTRKVAISTFNADGSKRGTLHREFTFR